MLSAQVRRLLLLASFLGRTMSNEAILLSESIDNLFLVNIPTEIPANTPSDTSKNTTFPSSQPAFEVDNSLGLSEDAHNTSTSFALDWMSQSSFMMNYLVRSINQSQSKTSTLRFHSII